MTLLGTFLFLSQRQAMLQRYGHDAARAREVLLDKGRAYGTFLARIAPQGILSHDYLLLEGDVEELSSDPDVAYAVILGGSGTLLTHVIRRSDAARPVTTSPATGMRTTRPRSTTAPRAAAARSRRSITTCRSSP